MIKRYTADEATDKSTMCGAKTVIAMLIIGTAVLCMAPALLCGEMVIVWCHGRNIPDRRCGTVIVEEMACARDGAKGTVLTLVDIKYVLLVAAIGSVAVLRVSGAPRGYRY